MNTDEFRKNGKEMVDYMANYLENIQKRRVIPGIEPGYLRHYLPSEPPQHAESFAKVMRDVDKFIMPGVSRLLLLFHFFYQKSDNTRTVKSRIWFFVADLGGGLYTRGAIYEGAIHETLQYYVSILPGTRFTHKVRNDEF